MNVIIEDYMRPVKRKSKALSKVPLLFLLLVDGKSASCEKPSFVDTPSCKTVRPGERFSMVIRADPGDPAKPYVLTPFKIRLLDERTCRLVFQKTDLIPDALTTAGLMSTLHPSILEMSEYIITISILPPF